MTSGNYLEVPAILTTFCESPGKKIDVSEDSAEDCQIVENSSILFANIAAVQKRANLVHLEYCKFSAK